MILAADSGATSTNWALISTKGLEKQFDTTGINPYYMQGAEIRRRLTEEALPQLSEDERKSIDRIYFYGSGCSTPAKRDLLRENLLLISPNASVFPDHDVLASARACCGRGKGIACILGTGSNACVYDGKNVVRNAISLGYLLGDEGSSVYIGKLFLTRYLKNRVSPSLKQAVDGHFRLSFEDILNGMYQSEKPNRFIAQFTYYILDHAPEFPELEEIIRIAFRDFITEYIRPFPEAGDYPVCFVGSVAHFAQKFLEEELRAAGYTMGKVVRYPIEGLIDYHWQQLLENK
ncbi:MAG: ATPase [Bacteroidales bacterium]|nr:ATPase [Bacteroidales bacterium]